MREGVVNDVVWCGMGGRVHDDVIMSDVIAVLCGRGDDCGANHANHYTAWHGIEVSVSKYCIVV